MSVKMDGDDRFRKLDRHVLRDRAAAVAARDHELFVAKHLGHEPVQQLGRRADARNSVAGGTMPVNANPGNDGTTTSKVVSAHRHRARRSSTESLSGNAEMNRASRAATTKYWLQPESGRMHIVNIRVADPRHEMRS